MSNSFLINWATCHSEAAGSRLAVDDIGSHVAMDQSKRNRASQNDRRSFLKSEMMPEGKLLRETQGRLQTSSNPPVQWMQWHSRQEPQHHPVLLIKHFSSHVMWCEHFLLWRNMMKPEQCSPLSFHTSSWINPRHKLGSKVPPPKKNLEIPSGW